MHAYNCDVCRARGLDKTRACFRFHEMQPVRPVRAAGSRYYTNLHKHRYMTRDEVWPEVERMEQWWPERNTLDHLIYGLNVCPEGMVTDWAVEMITREATCETYKTPPAEGGTDAWPARLFDAFAMIRHTQQSVKIEAVRALRSRQGKK